MHLERYVAVGLLACLTAQRAHCADAIAQRAADCAIQKAGTNFKFRVARAVTSGLPTNQGIVPSLTVLVTLSFSNP